MGLIYHAVLKNGLIMRFMDLHPWNALLPVFSRLLDFGKMNRGFVQIECRNRCSPYLNTRTCGHLLRTVSSALPPAEDAAAVA